jgi:UDP-N-acetylmuramoyl-tripeptide--D-alanyl-D-alanine ligase
MHAGPTRDVLVALARHARSEFRGSVVAITGSVGKTTTKDLTHHVLSHAGPADKTIGNRNSLAGACNAIINRPLASRFTVMELAATQPGDLMMARVVRPHVGVVTNVGISHAQSFSSVGGILREKVSLFDHLEGEGAAIVHRSVLAADDAGERLIRAKNLACLIVVGDSPDDDVHLCDTTFDGTATEGTMSVLGRRYKFRLILPARHFAENAMFAMAVAAALGLDVERLIPTLATAPTTSRRFQRYRVTIPGGSIELIDDAYNAAPASVAAMLDSLGRRVADRKVLVLGDMLELGDESPRFHREIAPLIAHAGVDLLVTVGDLARLAAPREIETVAFADAAAAAAALPSLVRPNDLVAVKASNAVGLGQAVAAILRMEPQAPPATGVSRPKDDRRVALPTGVNAPPPPSRVLVDPIAGKVLFEEYGRVQRRPASLTKLMLLYLVFSGLGVGRFRLDDTLQMTIAGARSRGSRLGCPPGTVLSVEQAVTALAVASANDVAVAVTETLAGSTSAAVGAMNDAASAMGLTATRFATPHGLDASGQVTNAIDMTRLATRVYMDFPDHRRFFEMRSFHYQGMAIANRNTLLPAYAGMNGMKTGTTPRAGCHLIGSAERNGQHLIAVVMGCASKRMRNEATGALLDFGFGLSANATAAGNPSPPNAASVPP